jgi:hypothetical protein
MNLEQQKIEYMGSLCTEVFIKRKLTRARDSDKRGDPRSNGANGLVDAVINSKICIPSTKHGVKKMCRILNKSTKANLASTALNADECINGRKVAVSRLDIFLGSNASRLNDEEQ